MIPRLIAFEGIDGAGKSTQIKCIAKLMEQQGWQVLTVSDPGSTKLGESIGELVRANGRDIVPLAEMFLFQVARTEMVATLIKPALDAGKIVLTDRFTASTVAYQGDGHGIDATIIAQANEIACQGVKPDTQILLDIDIDESIKRIGNRAASRIENFPIKHRERVLKSYRRQAREDEARWIQVDGAQPGAQVTDAIWTKLRFRYPSAFSAGGAQNA